MHAAMLGHPSVNMRTFSLGPSRRLRQRCDHPHCALGCFRAPTLEQINLHSTSLCLCSCCLFPSVFFGTNKIDTTISLHRSGRSTDHIIAGTPSLANHNFDTELLPNSQAFIQLSHPAPLRIVCLLALPGCLRCQVHYRRYVHITKSAGKVRQLGEQGLNRIFCEQILIGLEAYPATCRSTNSVAKPRQGTH